MPQLPLMLPLILSPMPPLTATLASRPLLPLQSRLGRRLGPHLRYSNIPACLAFITCVLTISAPSDLFFRLLATTGLQY